MKVKIVTKFQSEKVKANRSKFVFNQLKNLIIYIISLLIKTEHLNKDCKKLES